MSRHLLLQVVFARAAPLAAERAARQGPAADRTPIGLGARHCPSRSSSSPVNLGRKLAQVVKGASPASLPATYHAERNPVGARVLKHMMELTALNRGDDRTNALRETMSEVMQMDGPRKWYTAMMSGLDIRYDLGQGHPLLGRRMPDLDLITDDGPLRLFSLLQDARPVLLDFGGSGRLDAPGWEDRDVAWVGDQTRQGLTDVLTAWFGQHAAG